MKFPGQGRPGVTIRDAQPIAMKKAEKSAATGKRLLGKDAKKYYSAKRKVPVILHAVVKERIDLDRAESSCRSEKTSDPQSGGRRGRGGPAVGPSVCLCGRHTQSRERRLGMSVA